MGLAIAVIVVAALYALFHGHHYNRRRRAGLSVRESIPGPFGSWTSVSKRFRE
jgi:hypothetical protein